MDRPACPWCGSSGVLKWGRPAGRQRFRCRSCGKTFTGLTGTIRAHLHHRDRWYGLGGCLRESLSVRASGRILGVHYSTAFRWRHRALTRIRVLNRGLLFAHINVSLSGDFGRKCRLLAWIVRFRRTSRRYETNYLTWFSWRDQAEELEDELLHRPPNGLHGLRDGTQGSLQDGLPGGLRHGPQHEPSEGPRHGPQCGTPNGSWDRPQHETSEGPRHGPQHGTPNGPWDRPQHGLSKGSPGSSPFVRPTPMHSATEHRNCGNGAALLALGERWWAHQRSSGGRMAFSSGVLSGGTARSHPVTIAVREWGSDSTR